MTVDVKMESVNTTSLNAVPPSRSSLPYQDPNFQRAGELAVSGSKDIVAVYGSSPRGVPETLLLGARGMMEEEVATKRMVGLEGSAGVGKSALACSILGTEGVALVDSQGEAVTCFPVEYQYKNANQRAKYTVRCYFPHAADLEKTVGDILDDLNAFRDIDQSDLDANEHRIIFDKVKAAKKTCKELFGTMNDFDIRHLAIGTGQVTRESAMESLLRWSSQLPWPEDSENGVWHCEIESIEGLQSALKRFRMNNLWHLVKKITVFLEAAALRSGVVLVDLPGHNDANAARVRIAEETAEKCDDILVVGNINRAADNPLLSITLQKVVSENTPCPELGMLRLQTVTAVCTHSGVIERDTKRDYGDIWNPADAEIARLFGNNAPCQMVESVEKQAKVRTMKLRNERVTSKILENYQSTLDPGQFRVFCVDNSLYFTGQDTEELSGIPTLQHYLASLPAKTLYQLSVARLSRYDATVSSFENWVLSSMPRADDLIPILPEPKTLLAFDTQLEDWLSAAIADFTSTVINPLQVAKSRIVAANCNIVHDDWESYHHSTVAAICRREGQTRGTAAEDDPEWNSVLIGLLRKETQDNWLVFDNRLKSSLAMLHRNISDTFQNCPRKYKELGAPETFLKGLSTRQKILDEAFGIVRDNIMQELGSIKRNAVISQTNSYVQGYMRGVYKGALDIKGKGARDARISHLDSQVAGDSFVTTITDTILSRFEALVTRNVTQLEAKVKEVCDAVHTDVEVFQGKRDEIALFKLDPDLGKRAKDLLRRIKAEMTEIVELTRPAHELAEQMYGAGILPPRLGESEAP